MKIRKKRKIKICFLILDAYPLFNTQTGTRDGRRFFGGAEIDLYLLAEKISNLNKYEVIFWVGDYGQKDTELSGNISIRKFKYFEHLSNLSIIQKVFRKLMLIKQLFGMDGDIFITETASRLVGLLAVFIKILRGKKLIFRLASDVNTDLSFYRSSRRTYFLYKFGVYHCNLIICQSNTQKKLLKKNLNLDGIVIKNALKIKNIVRPQIKNHILWVGRGIPLKRPELFIELARRLPDENFTMIMTGDTDTKKNTIKSMNGLNNITLLDYVPFNRIQEYYNTAKLFVNTSEYEGFPNSFLQACIGKTPILSLRVNPDEFITRYDIGCVCNDNIGLAVEFINNLDNNKITIYGNSAYNYIIQNHDIDCIVKQYERVFEGLAPISKGKYSKGDIVKNAGNT